MNKKATIGGILALMAVMPLPAEAGRWINGGTFDVARGVGVNFLRFLADEGEGQMTIRCDMDVGLWIDAGAAGNGELPDGLLAGDRIEATFAFDRSGSVETVSAFGELVIRNDGAVLASITGADAALLAPALLQPAERLDITIGGISASIEMTGFAERAAGLADRCGNWPG
jgi:hypothetical protein